MEKLSLDRELKENAYPGRGIVIGISPDGTESGNCLFYHGKKQQQP